VSDAELDSLNALMEESNADGTKVDSIPKGPQ
jgi:hypothetical protein